jgi:hypothetical protein
MIMNINETWGNDHTASIYYPVGFCLYSRAYGFDAVASDKQTASVPGITSAIDNAGIGD